MKKLKHVLAVVITLVIAMGGFVGCGEKEPAWLADPSKVMVELFDPLAEPEKVSYPLSTIAEQTLEFTYQFDGLPHIPTVRMMFEGEQVGYTNRQSSKKFNEETGEYEYTDFISQVGKYQVVCELRKSKATNYIYEIIQIVFVYEIV